MVDMRFVRHDLDSCLAHVAEECGELVAAIGKAMRWGCNSTNPLLPPEDRETNAQWIRREIVDLREALERLEKVLP